jgi:opacity protein-like surface antigen
MGKYTAMGTQGLLPWEIITFLTSEELPVILYQRLHFFPLSREVHVKKSILLLFILLCSLLILVHVPASAMERFHEDEDTEINTVFGFQGWFSQADAKWRISFPYTTSVANPGISAGTAGRNESELSFKKIDSPITIASAGWKMTQLLSLDFVYGYGSISGGKGTDTDRFNANNGASLEYSRSTNDITGESRLWGGDLYYNNKKYTGAQTNPWGFVVGVLHYEDSLRMRNAVQVVSIPFEGMTFPPPGPFASNLVLNQTYDFSWTMMKTGVLRQAELAKGLSYLATLSIYPYVDYRGEGYWNLRAGSGPNDFRTQPPNFVQTSTTGYGYDASLGLIYEVSENLELSAGYRYFYLYAENGTDTTYFANGAVYEDSLDWVTVTRQGAYAELLLKF